MAIEKAAIDGVENIKTCWGLFNDLVDEIEDNGVLLYEIIETTRDMSTASGDQVISISGWGRIFIGLGCTTSQEGSWGLDHQPNYGGINKAAAAYGEFSYGEFLFKFDEAGSQTAIISDKTTTQITLTWTKSGSPTGTAYLKILKLS